MIDLYEAEVPLKYRREIIEEPMRRAQVEVREFSFRTCRQSYTKRKKDNLGFQGGGVVRWWLRRVGGWSLTRPDANSLGLHAEETLRPSCKYRRWHKITHPRDRFSKLKYSKKSASPEKGAAEKISLRTAFRKRVVWYWNHIWCAE